LHFSTKNSNFATKELIFLREKEMTETEKKISILPNEALSILYELTAADSLDQAVFSLLGMYLETEIQHWQAKNEAFEHHYGMNFEDYETRCRSDYDGSDALKMIAFQEWETAFSLCVHYKKLFDQWKLINSKEKFATH
jgi:hypothetical protein